MYSRLIREKLAEYRQIYEEWQQYMQNEYNEPFKKISDDVLIAIALARETEEKQKLMKANKRNTCGHV